MNADSHDVVTRESFELLARKLNGFHSHARLSVEGLPPSGDESWFVGTDEGYQLVERDVIRGVVARVRPGAHSVIAAIVAALVRWEDAETEKWRALLGSGELVGLLHECLSLLDPESDLAKRVVGQVGAGGAS